MTKQYNLYKNVATERIYRNLEYEYDFYKPSKHRDSLEK